ncbi:hypothetical protein GCM10029992_17260 [Glycomyces albus]
MADTKAISVRGIDLDLYRWLKLRAAQHGRSMEAEARTIFADARRVEEESSSDMSLGAYLRPLIDKYGAIDGLELPSRDDIAEGFDFSDWDVPE